MSSESPTYSSNTSGDGNNNKPNWKPHFLNKGEISEIPDKEREALFSMPVEVDSIWTSSPTKAGRESYTTVPIAVKTVAPNFHGMLKGIIDNPSMSHLILNDYSFIMTKDKVIRTKYTPSVQGKSFPPKQPDKFVSGVFFGDQDKVNDFLNDNQNLNKWHLYGDWKLDGSGKVVVGLFKT